MEKIKEFIIEYLEREYELPDDIDVMTFNYVDSGYVDSLGLIQFITIVEDEFGIAFSDEDLANPDIKVVGKLINMIAEKMGE